MKFLKVNVYLQASVVFLLNQQHINDRDAILYLKYSTHSGISLHGNEKEVVLDVVIYI